MRETLTQQGLRRTCDVRGFDGLTDHPATIQAVADPLKPHRNHFPEAIELAAFEPLVMDPESIHIPLKNFYFISLVVCENKHGGRKGIQSKTCLHNGDKPVDGFPHINRVPCQVDLMCAE